jgi:hypothetical protein
MYLPPPPRPFQKTHNKKMIEIRLHEIARRERGEELEALMNRHYSTVRLSFSGRLFDHGDTARLQNIFNPRFFWPSSVNLLEIFCDEIPSDGTILALLLSLIRLPGPRVISVRLWPRDQNRVLIDTLLERRGNLKSVALFVTSHQDIDQMVRLVNSGIPDLVLRFEDPDDNKKDWTPFGAAIAVSTSLINLGLGGYVPASAYPDHLPAGLSTFQLTCDRAADFRWLHHHYWPRNLQKLVIKDTGTDIFLPPEIIDRLRPVEEVIIGDERMVFPEKETISVKIDPSRLRACLRLIQEAKLHVVVNGGVQISTSDKDGREFITVAFFNVHGGAKKEVGIPISKQTSHELISRLSTSSGIMELEALPDNSKTRVSMPPSWSKVVTNSQQSLAMSEELRNKLRGTHGVTISPIFICNTLAHLSQFGETVDIAIQSKTVLLVAAGGMTLRVEGMHVKYEAPLFFIKRLPIHRLLEFFRFGTQFIDKAKCGLRIAPAVPGIFVQFPYHGMPNTMEGLFKSIKKRGDRT